MGRGCKQLRQKKDLKRLGRGSRSTKGGGYLSN